MHLDIPLQLKLLRTPLFSHRIEEVATILPSGMAMCMAFVRLSEQRWTKDRSWTNVKTGSVRRGFTPVSLGKSIGRV